MRLARRFPRGAHPHSEGTTLGGRHRPRRPGSDTKGPMDRRMVRVATLAAWMLWQEILLPNTSSLPSWHLDSEFSGESACDEGRKTRIIEQILRAGDDGTIIIN
jgi:hypothetical protein